MTDGQDRRPIYIGPCPARPSVICTTRKSLDVSVPSVPLRPGRCPAPPESILVSGQGPRHWSPRRAVASNCNKRSTSRIAIRSRSSWKSMPALVAPPLRPIEKKNRYSKHWNSWPRRLHPSGPRQPKISLARIMHGPLEDAVRLHARRRRWARAGRPGGAGRQTPVLRHHAHCGMKSENVISSVSPGECFDSNVANRVCGVH